MAFLHFQCLADFLFGINYCLLLLVYSGLRRNMNTSLTEEMRKMPPTGKSVLVHLLQRWSLVSYKEFCWVCNLKNEMNLIFFSHSVLFVFFMLLWQLHLYIFLSTFALVEFLTLRRFLFVVNYDYANLCLFFGLYSVINSKYTWQLMKHLP